MSFILDALRKSEHARQHLGGATLAELPLGRRQRAQPWWVIALAALLIVNVIVLVMVLFKKPAPDVAVTTPAPVVRESARAAAPSIAAPSVAAPAPLAEEVAPASSVQYETIPRSESPLDNDPPGPTLVRSIETPPVQASAPPVASVAGVPPLHLDMLVYAKDPNERFAFINKHKYTEGQTMAEGPRIAEITPEGVVLLFQGQRMELTRQ